MTTTSKGKVLFTVRRPRNIGKMLAELAAAFVLSFLLFLVVTFEHPYDGTDWPEMETRSGLTLYIDHGTGCHWLRAGFFGNLVPRLNVNQMQVCVKSDLRQPTTST